MRLKFWKKVRYRKLYLLLYLMFMLKSPRIYISFCQLRIFYSYHTEVNRSYLFGFLIEKYVRWAKIQLFQLLPHVGNWHVRFEDSASNFFCIFGCTISVLICARERFNFWYNCFVWGYSQTGRKYCKYDLLDTTFFAFEMQDASGVFFTRFLTAAICTSPCGLTDKKRLKCESTCGKKKVVTYFD